MDGWQVAQNYIVAAAIGGAVGGYYYYTANQKKPNRTGSLNAITPRRSETDLRGRNIRRNTQDRSTTGTPDSRQSSAGTRKRKTRADGVQQPKHQPSLEVIEDKPTKESDMSAAQFATKMQQARQGTNLQTTKTKDTRVKTVKPRAAANSSAVSLDEPQSPQVSAGDVSDMLEPTAPAPNTLRITAPTEPQRVKMPRQPKQEEVVETKKQRQNRKKVEERRALREESEAERKTLEERQRRTAREARGEPAKNGIPVSRAPLNNPWEQRDVAAGASVQAADTNGAHSVMLDTFDAESTSSSNGGPGVSTAATSTTSGEQPRYDPALEEEQLAAALKQSNEESGWTTVSAPVKKSKKKTGELDSGAATPMTEQGKAAGKGQARSGAYAALGTDNENVAE